jgi:hypothetical protein
MTGRNGRGSWERQGITAFCTRQWIDWIDIVLTTWLRLCVLWAEGHEMYHILNRRLEAALCWTVSLSCSCQRDVQNMAVRITKPLLSIYCYSLIGNNRQNLHILKHWLWRGVLLHLGIHFHICFNSIWWWPKWTHVVNDK